MTAAEIARALSCGRSGCSCGREIKPGEYLTHCPRPESHAQGDRTPSLTVKASGDKLLVKCFGGCSQAAVIEALKAKGLWPSRNGDRPRAATGGGLTLADFARAKKLDPVFLAKHGATQATGKGGPYLVFSYRDPDGKPIDQATRFRFSMAEKPKSKKGGVPALYGLWRLADFRPGGEVIICEGESDTLTFWSYDLPAVGLPGKGLTKTISPDHFTGFETVYVWQEPDAPELPGKVAARLPGETVKAFIPPDGIKDISEAHCQGMNVKELVDRLKAEAHEVNLEDDYEAQERAAIQKEPALVRPKLITLSGADLAVKSIPEIRWAIPGLLPEGYGLLGGRPKMGKSWLTLDFCLSVALGGFAIGSDLYRAHGGEALYLALEDNERRLQDRQRTLTENGPGALRLHLVLDFPRLNEGGLEILGDWLKDHPACGIVVIDTLAKVKPRLKRGVDAYEHEMEAGGNLQKLANKHRVCLLAVHHTRKAKPDYDDFVDELAGSTGITGAADFIMVLSRGRGADTATLRLTGKDVEEMDLALRFSRGTWTLLGEAQEYNVSEQRLSILDIIKKSPDPMTPKEISELTGIPYGSVKHLILELNQSNLIERIGHGKYRKK